MAPELSEGLAHGRQVPDILFPPLITADIIPADGSHSHGRIAICRRATAPVSEQKSRPYAVVSRCLDAAVVFWEKFACDSCKSGQV